MAKKDDRSRPALPEAERNRIGSKLRSIFNDLESEPLPDRLRELLEQLDVTPEAPPPLRDDKPAAFAAENAFEQEGRRI